MRKTTLALFAAAMLLVTPLPGTAQGPGGRANMGGPGQRLSSVGFLLDQADELDLSDDQRMGLEGVLAQLDETSAPTLEGLAALRESGDRTNMRSQARPLMEQLRELDRDALSEAMELFSDEQRTLAEALLTEFREQRGRPARPGRGR